jgi:hypothetical protein
MQMMKTMSLIHAMTNGILLSLVRNCGFRLFPEG